MTDDSTYITTLTHVLAGLEKQMKEQHTLMQKVRNEFMALKRQHTDLTVILKKLEDDNKNTR